MRGENSKMIKLLICILMCSLTLFGLCGCGSAGGDGGNNSLTSSSRLLTTAYGSTPEEVTSDVTSDEDLWETQGKIYDIFVELFKRAANGEENSMVSPLSISIAMSMLENGAEEETLAEIEKTFGMDKDELKTWIKSWMVDQTERENTKINIANSFWFREGEKGIEPKQAFLDTLSKDYKAEAYASRFDENTLKDMNSWCDKNTDGMIKKIVDNISADQMAYLINAIAFEGKWLEEYKEDAVKEEKFTTEKGEKQDATLMYSNESTYIHDSMATGFMKPYMDGYSFMAVLPDEGVSVKEYMDKMTGKSFSNLFDSQENAVVHAVLPKFTSEYSTKDRLIPVFKNMGISRVFNPDEANLKGMAELEDANLYVNEIIHKTYIDVNEQGTKAAAATSIVIDKATSARPQPIKEYTVRLDRPFIYAIIDEYTGTPVFMGTMMSVK